VGLNAVEKMQVAATARELPHVLAVRTKEDAPAPPRTMEERLAATVPVFLTVTVKAGVCNPMPAGPKPMLVADKVTAVPAGLPVPFSATLCGEPVALSVTAMPADKLPVVVGLNAAEKMQLAATASEVPQVLAVIKYDDAPVPVRLIELIVTARVPTFLRVTVCTGVSTPTVSVPKLRMPAESDTTAPELLPVPVRATV
jgi:hypothetical protein